MKKIYYIVLILIGLQSCHKEELPVPYGNVHIFINFEEGYTSFSKKNIEVLLINEDGSLVKKGKTNETGKVTFTNIVNDTYQIKIAHTFDKTTVFKKIGIKKDLDFIGGSNAVLITANQTQESKIVLKTNKIGGFVIKEVYNSNAGGGRDLGGFYEYIRFNDSFFEIYNNSPQTLYADGLQIGVISNLYEDTWRKDDKHLYIEQIFTIKGDGKKHPVAPGKSVLIAATAINHINAEGLSKKEVNNLFLFGTVKKSVDLSISDFETYFEGFATNYDIDVAKVPNLKVAFNTHSKISEIVTSNRGIGLAIFKNVAVNSLEKVQLKRGRIETRTYQYVKLPNNIIIDAFEAQTKQNFPTQVVGEHLEVLETWQGKSYRRKISTTIQGRKILLDTDNCVTDFIALNKATPKSF